MNLLEPQARPTGRASDAKRRSEEQNISNELRPFGWILNTRGYYSFIMTSGASGRRRAKQFDVDVAGGRL